MFGLRLLARVAVLAMVLPCGAAPATAQNSFDHGYGPYAALLRAHVRGDRIDYRALKDNRAALDAVVCSFGAASEQDLQGWSLPQQIAFWINAYNVFMLDRQGRVTARFFEQAYQERTTVSTMLLNSGIGIERPVTTAETAHLRLRAWAGDAALVPGRHVSLVVDVTPLTGMHVNAPGATGCRVVALTLDEVTGVRPLDTSYPPSETYYFAPLKERVPVYMRAFRLTREVLLDPSPLGAAALGARASLTVSGRLDYQACDDKICYNPVSIPLSWSFTVGELDRERAQRR